MKQDFFIRFFNGTYKRLLCLMFFVFIVLILSSPIHQKVSSSETEKISNALQKTKERIKTMPGPSIVSVNGRQLIVQKRNPNGTLEPAVPYTIHGVNWSPASQNTNTSTTDPNNANVRRPEFGIWAATDIPLMRNMNVNTVRMLIDPGFDANGRAVLDQLYSNGIMVIMTVDDAVNNMARVQQVVNFYKDHPAILMWMLGSEWNINRYFTNPPISVTEAAQRTQQAAALIKTLDTVHPVATSYGEIDINGGMSVTQGFVNQTCPSVDIWALNIYRGNTFGTLFEQWRAISSKPMLIGEFGTDAFRSFNQNHPPDGTYDETLQWQWTLSEWNHIFKNLSAVNPSNVAIGGFVFEWNDEWWKVQPWGTQQVDGCNAFDGCAGHPDQFGNEEYFGIVDINRQPRLLYQTLTTAFAPNYQPPHSITYRAMSRGFTAQEYTFQNGVCRFFKDGRLIHQVIGGAGGGRGFNVAVIDSCTSELKYPIQNFDTYIDSTRMIAMTNFLNSLSNGDLVLIGVADEAGLKNPSCMSFEYPWQESFYLALESLGSIRIRQYCFRDSWSLSAIKGSPQTAQEQLMTTSEANASLALPIQTTISPTSHFFTRNAGSSTVTVTSPNNCNWTAVSNNPDWLNITSGSSGNGNGIVSFSATSNSGYIRTGTMTIAGQTFIVNQSNATAINRKPFDFDGDSKTDISIFRPSLGQWWYLRSSDLGNRAFQFGQSSDKIVPADFTGDGKTDVAFWRPSTGERFVLRSEDNSFFAFPFGTNGDVPVPADFDGDGKADPAVFRPANSTWFILNSSGGTTIQPFGLTDDAPIPNDFDGDGKADLAVYRPSESQWFYQRSTDLVVKGFQFGASGDKAVPADFTGDGKTDIAFWRPGSGEWYILRSEDNSFFAFPFGTNGDIPVAGDYDGDGKADAAVFRPSNNIWYLQRSTAGFTAVQFGIANDIPIPSAYTP